MAGTLFSRFSWNSQSQGDHRFRRRGEIAYPTKQAKARTKPVKLKNKHDSLLEVGAHEKRSIRAYNFINGFGQFSTVPGAVQEITARYLALTSAVALGEIFGFIGVGLAGLLYGALFAYIEVDEEQEKAIRLNKELFLLFNLAADKREKAKKTDNEDEYHKIHKKIHIALSASSAELCHEEPDEIKVEEKKVEDEKRQEQQKNSSGIPKEIRRMDAIIKEYAAHRKENKDEMDLWNKLKGKFNQQDRKHVEFFINHRNYKQATKYFDFHKNLRARDFNYLLEEILKKLNKVNVQRKHRADFKSSVAAFKTVMEHLHDFADSFSDQAFKSSPEEKELGAVIKSGLDRAQESYALIYSSIPSETESEIEKKQEIVEIWESLTPLIKEVDYYFKDLFNAESKLIVNETDKIFGEGDSSFRRFWRDELPNKKYQFNNEAIPLNFEQKIYRGGANVGKWQVAKTGGFTLLGLCLTGNSLYAASVALGAAALSSTGVGMIVVGAIALALTCIGAYYYYQAKKTQNNRNALEEKLKETRKQLMPELRAPKATPASPKTSPISIFNRGKVDRGIQVDDQSVACLQSDVSDDELSISPASSLDSDEEVSPRSSLSLCQSLP